MNTNIFKLITAIVAVLFTTATTTAQGAKTMYLMKDGAVTHKVAVSDVDSIIFYEPAVVPAGGVLINGVVWATCNVDAPGTFAATPESSGMFYQWNRKKAWPATDDVTGWDSSTPTGTEWEKSNDPSPSGWRVPTAAELRTLFQTANVTNEWTTQNGVTGRKFTDKTTGAFIFLPAAGSRGSSAGTFSSAGTVGRYWSSTYSGSGDACILTFDGSSAGVVNYDPCVYGRSVRAVAENN